MTRAFPFVRPPHDVVRPEPWALSVSDGSAPLPEALPEWDYNTVLAMHRRVVVDARRARAGAGLRGDAPLTLSARWTASGSLLRGRGARVPLPEDHEVEVALSFELPGGELGGTLSLETLLSTAAPLPDAGERAATRPGSILWRDSYDVRLQGDAPLFPVAIVDFGDLAYPEGAAWFLEIDRDLDAAALGSMLLLVNERSGVLVRALAEAGNPSPDAAAVLSSLRSDIARTLIEHALAADDFVPGVDYESGTLGAALSVLLAQLDLDDVESLRREHLSEPSLFAARVQDATKLWEGLR